MWLFFVIIPILLLLFFGSVILPWLNKGKITLLKNEIETLKNIISGLNIRLSAYEVMDKVVDKTESKIKEEVAVPSLDKDEAAKISTMETQEKKIEEPVVEAKEVVEDKSLKEKKPKEVPIKVKPTMEQQFGARLPVWLGGIALALSGVFLVKYSLENNLVTPFMRVTLGILFGVVALFAGNWIRKRPDFANGSRISQSLSGAGVAILYAALFAATSLYGIIPSSIGFIAMGAVTLVALYLSLLYGPAIALLGLVGGFVTPALIGSSSPSAPLLFGYLYFVFAALIMVVRQQHWWKLSFIAIAGSFLWVLFWLDSSWSLGDGLWLGLFLLAMSGTTIFATWNKEDKEPSKNPMMLMNYLSFGGGVIMMSIVLQHSEFGMLEWGLFGLLAVASIVLAWLKPHIYSKAPYISLVASLVLLVIWNNAQDLEVLRVMLVFAVLYVGGGSALMWKTNSKVLWAKISCFAALAYYVFAYVRLFIDGHMLSENIWGVIAITLASCAVYSLFVLRKQNNIDDKLQVIFALTATVFISLALVIVLKSEWWGVAIAAEVFAIAWVNARVSIAKLRQLAGGLFILVGFMLLPQIAILFSVMLSSITPNIGGVAKLGNNLFDWPLLQFGLTGLFFVGAGHFLRQQKIDKLVTVLEWSGLMLMAAGAYYMVRQLFNVDVNILSVQAGFFERSVITNMLFAFALACLIGRRLLGRNAYGIAGLTFLVLATLRVYYFDLLMLNPVWAHQNVGSMPVFNSLWFSYAVPIVWAYLCKREILEMRVPEFLQLNKTMLILLVSFVSLQVRQFYHGEYLNVGATTDAEIYTYSAIWLLTGIGMLTAGIIRNDKLMRYASLGIITLAVAKVFLYDASALEGLYRVFSFFGLGVSLIGISYVYTRFVFKENSHKRK